MTDEPLLDVRITEVDPAGDGLAQYDGRTSVDALHPADMFPHTAHVEAIGPLRCTVS